MSQETLPACTDTQTDTKGYKASTKRVDTDTHTQTGTHDLHIIASSNQTRFVII